MRKGTPFDYNIRVKTLPMNVSNYQPLGTFNKILARIDNKKTVFVTDSSWSMHKPGGIYNRTQISRMECLKVFLKRFIEKLEDNSYMSIQPYYVEPLKSCTHPKLFPLTKIGGNENRLKNKINELKAERANTSICIGLEQGFDYSIDAGADVIVLMTDGCENICCGDNCTKRCAGKRNCTCNTNNESVKVASNYKSENIPVITIGYGKEGVCYRPTLTEIAKMTGGESFRVKTCEELIPKDVPEKNIEFSKEEWSFGMDQFSTGDAREDSLTLSLPVSVRYGPQDYKRGVIYLEAAKGKLERLSRYINRVCDLASEGRKNVGLSPGVEH